MAHDNSVRPVPGNDSWMLTNAMLVPVRLNEMIVDARAAATKDHHACRIDSAEVSWVKGTERVCTEYSGSVECTANPGDGEIPPHLLMTPPCICPKCLAAEPEPIEDDEGPGWLRVSGLQQRLRVENIELGVDGADALG